ncbi:MULTISPECIES: GNAT family N-acetyltransferase [Vibrio]|uniref:GNAT family acetyltransferase n=1 Tax=Vibrio coralliilyticus TaxID=190893 RepID=A0AAN0W0N9_9VIBR|nr:MULTISPECIES: GNAT family N-acetyltransferase [Vibrio]AIW22865.1 GNAT family acetyltransferase [Vibrio coralliilyticus]MCM5511099.1 GNAT family N-acetyltransferase [Vibrio sp. SCSIO 43169]NOH38381.1 GNAT family N-acetyltransferase [Vibrio coralliilyticus]NOH55195.1 GNAT family N-acetyltransferase [Vibrio coralliilyticus]QFT39785.1 aminoalkylphosphonic acid N-acetyltransferase [Vibrio sp. THAF64]
MVLEYRSAQFEDLENLVSLLANDPLGSKREDPNIPINKAYHSALKAITCDPNNELLVVELEGLLVGMLQVTFIPYLTHVGSWRCLIEGVRIHEKFRGRGFGEQMFQHAIKLAKSKGCNLVQLTSDKQRPDAIRFYERLGFKATHEGFKLAL